MVKEGIKGTLKVHGELQVELSLTKEDNKDISRRFLEGVWNLGNMAIINDLIAETYVDNTPPPSAADVELRGRELLKRVVTTIRDSFSAIHVSIGEQIAEDDRVVTPVNWEYTFESTDPSLPSQVIKIMGIAIDRIADGQIVESWNTFDVPYRVLNRLELPDPVPGGPETPQGCRGGCGPGYVCEHGTCAIRRNRF